MTFGCQQHGVLVASVKLDDLVALEGKLYLAWLLVVCLATSPQLAKVTLAPGVQALKSFVVLADFSESQTVKPSSLNLRNFANLICIFDKEQNLDRSVEAIWLLVVQHSALSLVEGSSV